MITRKRISLLTVLSLLAVMIGPALAVPFSKAHAAKFADGTWSQSGAPGTTTIVFTTTGALDQDDTILLTFPSQADVNASGTNITLTCGTATRSNNDTANQVTVTLSAGASCSGSSSVTVTMTDGLTSYTTTTYAQQSVAITTGNEGVATLQDYGVGIKTNDNTTDVTANVPLFVTMAVDTTTINLATLTTSAVSEQDQTYTVNSNNDTGVQVQITSDGDLNTGTGDTINAVGDGTVTAGSEEYGISIDNVSGLTAQSPFNSGDDAIPTSATNLANSSAEVASGTFDINYKASIAGTTPAGSYNQVVTITIATNA